MICRTTAITNVGVEISTSDHNVIERSCHLYCFVAVHAPSRMPLIAPMRKPPITKRKLTGTRLAISSLTEPDFGFWPQSPWITEVSQSQ